MSSCLCQCNDDIRQKAYELGAVACGFARAERISDDAIDVYDRWIGHGYHGTMQYCAAYGDVRNDPRLLLEGAKTVISCAFGYYNDDVDLPLANKVSRYAWGNDYHWTIKSRLTELGRYIVERYGGAYRICVDTAPIRERYWATRAGIGFIGLNNQLIIPGYGSYCFLGEVLWTGETVPDTPCLSTCDKCKRCVQACPGRALDGNGGCDATKCASYLTIEFRGDLNDTDAIGASYYGCDVCQKVCPHNTCVSTSIPEFKPVNPLLKMSEDGIRAMSSSQFRKLTRNSAMSRISLNQLLRNIEHGAQ